MLWIFWKGENAHWVPLDSGLLGKDCMGSALVTLGYSLNSLRVVFTALPNLSPYICPEAALSFLTLRTCLGDTDSLSSCNLSLGLLSPLSLAIFLQPSHTAWCRFRLQSSAHIGVLSVHHASCTSILTIVSATMHVLWRCSEMNEWMNEWARHTTDMGTQAQRS